MKIGYSKWFSIDLSPTPPIHYNFGLASDFYNLRLLNVDQHLLGHPAEMSDDVSPFTRLTSNLKLIYILWRNKNGFQVLLKDTDIF